MLDNRRLLIAFRALALAYAAVVNIRTVVDTDIGWQMATGRYLLDEGRLPRAEMFSYTARGVEWIYPPFSGVIFHLAHAVGGWHLLTWLGVAACVGTVLLLLPQGGITTAALAVLAVPAIGFSTLPRANMFSVVLFAACLAVLWRHYQTGTAPLWLLPLLMMLWVNLHPGFAAGLALIAAFAAAYLMRRERPPCKWFALAAAAVLVNPWGWRIFQAFGKQAELVSAQKGFVTEWTGASLDWRLLADVRNPASAYYWMLLVAVPAIVVWLWRREYAPALLLAGAAAVSMMYLRFQALFVIVAVVVAGAAISKMRIRETPAVSALLLVALLALAGTRISDLTANRYYLANEQIAIFGSGASRWYPERAAEFLLRERLPARVFNNFNVGGYLTWRITPQYEIYIDGRAIPFGPDLFTRNAALLQAPPDGAEWQHEASLRGIQTVILGTARYGGAAVTAARFCASQTWRPVYLDEVSAVFVRNLPQNAAWIDRLQVDCARAQFHPAPGLNRAELYNFYADAGSFLHALGRDQEAMSALDNALRIFNRDQNLRLMRGAVLQAQGSHAEAQREFAEAVALDHTPEAGFALGVSLANQARFEEATGAMERAAAKSRSHSMYLTLADVYLAMKKPREALAAFDQAEKHSPYHGPNMQLARPFLAALATGRAHAWHALGDFPRALQLQQQAVSFAPDDAARWLELAELYDAAGQPDRARDARQNATRLRQP